MTNNKALAIGVTIILSIGLLYLGWMIWLASNCGNDHADSKAQPTPTKKEEPVKIWYHAKINSFHKVQATEVDVIEFENKSNGIIVLNCSDGSRIITHISNVVLYRRSDK